MIDEWHQGQSPNKLANKRKRSGREDTHSISNICARYSKICKVSHSALHNRVRGNVPIDTKIGRPKALDEAGVMKFVVAVEQAQGSTGGNMTMPNAQALIASIARENGVAFKAGVPSQKYPAVG